MARHIVNNGILANNIALNDNNNSGAVLFYIYDVDEDDNLNENPDEYINQNFNSGAHLIRGVHKAINSDFKVLGLENLFVCDASILESFPSSNIHSGIVLLSSVFSEKFLSLSRKI